MCVEMLRHHRRWTALVNEDIVYTPQIINLQGKMVSKMSGKYSDRESNRY
ncbi:hypothetical protein DOY81_015121 [Sarcophaga bullata]|nr:hypothetical protein DOY81_015121 [Sarcophaga bullata]